MDIEVLVKKALNSTTLVSYGCAGSGGISQGKGYKTDNENIFVKTNHEKGVRFNDFLLDVVM